MWRLLLLVLLFIASELRGQSAQQLIAEGDSLYTLKKYDDAIFAYSKSADISLTNKDLPAAAGAYDRVAGLYQQLGNYEKSIEFGKKALEWHTQSNTLEAMAKCCSSLGTNHYYKGDFTEALNYYQRSLQLRRELKDSSGVADMLLNVGAVHNVMSNYLLAMEQYEEARTIRRQMGDKKGLASVLNNMGTILREQGRYAQSVECYTEALDIREQLNDTLGMVSSLVNIGIIYETQDYLDEALEHYDRSLALLEKVNDERYRSVVVNNVGGVHQKKKDFDEALRWFNRSSDIMLRIGNRAGYASTVSNIAEVQLQLGQTDIAAEKYNESLAIRKEIGDRKGIASAMMGLAKTQMVLGNDVKALSLADSALQEAQALNALTVIEEASGVLYKLYKKKNDSSKALSMYELNMAMKDSLSNKEHERTVMRMQFQADYERKNALMQEEQARKDALAQEQMKSRLLQRNIGFAGLGMMMIVAIVFFVQRNRISKEKSRSDSLLLNILPQSTANELKQNGVVKPMLHVNTSVLFTDFAGFTELASNLPAKELVTLLDNYFRAFDSVAQKHGLEKIKTIGDSYMAASGLTDNGPEATIAAVAAGLEMISETERVSKEHGVPLSIRVGIHTGPVVAGVVGKHKFQYDIWGDTVNTASRMESNGAPKKVNISHATYEQVHEAFECTYRGEMQVKGKGAMRMYFVDGVTTSA